MPKQLLGFGVGVARHSPYLVHDNFTDADGTLLVNHTPDKDIIGNGWRKIGVYLIDWEIDGNKADPITDSDADQPMLIDVGVRDVIIETIVTGEADAVWGQYFAYDSGAGNYYYIWWTDVANMTLAEVDSGGYTVRDVAAVPGASWAGSDKTVRVEISGGSVQVYVDDSLVLDFATMDQENPNGTEHGIFAKLGAEIRFDAFSVMGNS